MAKLALHFVHRSSRQNSFLDKSLNTSFDSVFSETLQKFFIVNGADVNATAPGDERVGPR